MSDNSKPTQNDALSFEQWLGKAERLDGAATEGPWAVKAGEVVARVDESPWPPQIAYATATGDVSFQPEDAEFIAWSRTALPAAVAALRAVADLHQPDVCWMDRLDCGACSSYDECVQWPCPTITTIQDTLGDHQ